MSRRGGAERLAAAAAAAFIAVYCVARYRDALLSFFFLDDFWLLRDVSALRWSSPLDLAQIFRPTHVGFQLYRPLTQTGYFALLWSVFGCDASGYHAVQLLAFACTALLVFGIARHLTGSIQAGLGASLIYATAPGHAVTAFWIAAFTMTGTALVVLLMLWAWLRIDSPRWRVTVCTVLQLIGLLASEHAVVGPILLALVGWGARPSEPWRRRLQLLLPPIALVAVYGAFKLWYLAAVRPPLGGYAASRDPVQWLMGAGQYALGSVSWFKLHRGVQPGRGSFIVGSTLVGIAVVAAWQARRGVDGWRLLATGVGVFLVALLPVLPLTKHFYDYFIGIAALGPALAAVGACQLTSRRAWPSLALAIGAGLVLYDVATGQQAAREDPIFGLVDGGARTAARWVEAVITANQPGVSEVAVPSNPVTDSVFALGHAERVLPGMPARVSVIPAWRQPVQLPGRVIVNVSPPSLHGFPDLPGWGDRWAWIRALGRWGVEPQAPPPLPDAPLIGRNDGQPVDAARSPLTAETRHHSSSRRHLLGAPRHTCRGGGATRQSRRTYRPGGARHALLDDVVRDAVKGDEVRQPGVRDQAARGMERHDLLVGSEGSAVQEIQREHLEGDPVDQQGAFGGRQRPRHQDPTPPLGGLARGVLVVDADRAFGTVGIEPLDHEAVIARPRKVLLGPALLVLDVR